VGHDLGLGTIPAEDVLGEAGHEEAGVPSGADLEEGANARFELEGGPDGPDETFAEKAAHRPGETPSRKGIGKAGGEELPSPAQRQGRCQRPSDLPEDRLGIGAAGHQPDEVTEFDTADPPVLPSLLFEPPDLNIHHPRETESPREGDAHILLDEDLTGTVVFPERLQKDEGNPRLHAPGASGGAGSRNRGFSFC
jgi:hypothetical protein